MKNIMIGIIGIFVTLYTLQIGLNILYVQTQKNQIEKHVSRIVKNTLEMEYQKGEEAYVEAMLLQEIRDVISTKSATLNIKVQGMDLEKGFLSVKVTKNVEMLNGREKTIVVEKTAILERTYISDTESVSCGFTTGSGHNTSWYI